MSGTTAREEQIAFRRELLRKATHMGALVIPVGYYLLRLDRQEALAVMIPITLGMILIDVSRLRRWRFWNNIARPLLSPLIRRREMAGDFTGATYILLSACVTIALYAKPIAVAALVFIVVGDVFAALVGRSIGRHRFGRKSIEGSLACLLATAAATVFLPDLPWSVRLFGAAVATAVEALPLGVDDNVSVPILAGLTMTLHTKILAGF